MRTIVINTSKEAKNTKLDLLFKAPFDHSSLLWYESELADIAGAADLIKQAIITDTDTVDRDYNLIVLVDLYAFPRGNDVNATRLYKALLTRYVGTVLVNKLNEEYSLLPLGTSVYFADSAQDFGDWRADSLNYDNPIEQQRRQNEVYLEEEKQRAASKKSGDLSDDAPEKTRKKEARNIEQRLIMSLFGWTEDTEKDNFSWALKSSVGSDESLDMSCVFGDVAEDIKKSHKSAKVLELAIKAVSEITVLESGDWDGGATVALPFISEYKARSLTCKFERDNEQALIEGFFNLFANIFTCVQTRKLTSEVKVYGIDKIKQMLLSALKKYKYFSDEDNVTVEFEPIAKIYEIRENIFKARRDASSSLNKNKGKTAYEVADEIMAETVSERETAVTQKMRGLDCEFHSLVESIFNNYDSELIKEQNSRIVKECLTGLWSWRDKQTAEDFKQTVNAELKNALAKENGGAQKSNVRETVAFIEAEYEREYSQLINEVTEAEHRLSANKNILLETKDLVLKYGDLMRKGKWYLISFIGALIAIAVSILPYIYVEHYAGTENLVFKILYLLFTAGFACLYGISAAIYTAKIVGKKRKLKDELEELKQKSESERRESIAALYKYYSETVVKTENHCLLWREILRRDRENSKKGIKRNNHIKHLEFLIGEVKRFMTMLKFDYEDDACAVTDDDVKRFKREGLCLDAEESFHSTGNQRIYSVLSDESPTEKNEEEGSI